MTHTATHVRRLLSEHGVRPSRALGQNFVADPNTVRRIVRLAGVGPGSHVVEIGAGLGSLTLALAEAGASVVALEIDRHLLPILREAVAGCPAQPAVSTVPATPHVPTTPTAPAEATAPFEPAVTVVAADALRVDFTEILGEERSWTLVANLPYNVATPLVVRVLEEAPQVDRLLVMVQREVGERLAARPGDPAYGAASVKVAYWAQARVVGRVPPTVFVPRPSVESALVRIERRPEPAVDPGIVPYDRLFSVVGAGFGQRRKMLRRSLAGVVVPAAFDAAGISPEARAEELGIEDWGRLAEQGRGMP